MNDENRIINARILECDKALEQLATVKTAYRIIGSVMIEKDAAALKEELLKEKEALQAQLRRENNEPSKNN